jgi:hypothetical protein
MRLKLERSDFHWTRKSNAFVVLDEVIGKCIGTVSIDRAPSHRSYPTRTIQLFDSKYTSSFNTHAECVAFVKGVEAVLNHMLKAKDLKSVKAALNHMLEAKSLGPAESTD